MAFNFKDFFLRRKTKEGDIQSQRRSISYSKGVAVHEDSAMQVSAFYRGVIYISTQLAKLPWEVKDRDNNNIENGVSFLIGLQPNPEMNAFNFRALVIQDAIIHGNFYAEIERDYKGQPIALWPIYSKDVLPMRTTTGELVYKVTGTSANKQDLYLRKNDVFHVKNFHTKDGILGQGVMAYGSDVLGISLGADRMAYNLFANGGIPSGTLEVPGVLSDEAFKRIKDSWNENHSGRKTGGIAVLEEGAKFNPINMDPNVMQFLESRKFGVIEISRFLGLPPTKLFDTGAATYNNTENANLEVATDTLDAWAKNLEMEADIKLLSGRFGGKRTELDLYEIFRGDMKTRADYFSKMMQTAAMSPNEIRRKEKLPSYEGGDRYFVAVNNYSPADRIDEIIDAQVSKGNDNKAPVEKADTGVKAELDSAVIDFLNRK